MAILRERKFNSLCNEYIGGGPGEAVRQGPGVHEDKAGRRSGVVVLQPLC